MIFCAYIQLITINYPYSMCLLSLCVYLKVNHCFIFACLFLDKIPYLYLTDSTFL